MYESLLLYLDWMVLNLKKQKMMFTACFTRLHVFSKSNAVDKMPLWGGRWALTTCFMSPSKYAHKLDELAMPEEPHVIYG